MWIATIILMEREKKFVIQSHIE